MMTLGKPVYWGQNLVKVVMLIAIAEIELEIYKDTLKVLYSKIDSYSYNYICEKQRNKRVFIWTIYIHHSTDDFEKSSVDFLFPIILDKTFI